MKPEPALGQKTAAEKCGISFYRIGLTVQTVGNGYLLSNVLRHGCLTKYVVSFVHVLKEHIFVETPKPSPSP